jgi:hypothetical protein
MGANQSAGRPPSPKSIPIRPRTPLRFGSVPTPLPVDPSRYNTRPIRNLYPSIPTQDSVISLLSQESYFCSPLSPGSSMEDEDTPSPQPYSVPPRLFCPHSNCNCSVAGFEKPGDLDLHFHSETHLALNPIMTVSSQSVQRASQQPPIMNSEQQCSCAHCIYQEWPTSPYPQPMHMEVDYVYQAPLWQPFVHLQMQMPRLRGYNGPEVENLNWSGEKIPKTSMPMMTGSYPPVKRQRLDFPLIL